MEFFHIMLINKILLFKMLY